MDIATLLDSVIFHVLVDEIKDFIIFDEVIPPYQLLYINVSLGSIAKNLHFLPRSCLMCCHMCTRKVNWII